MKQTTVKFLKDFVIEGKVIYNEGDEILSSESSMWSFFVNGVKFDLLQMEKEQQIKILRDRIVKIPYEKAEIMMDDIIFPDDYRISITAWKESAVDHINSKYKHVLLTYHHKEKSILDQQIWIPFTLEGALFLNNISDAIKVKLKKNE